MRTQDHINRKIGEVRYELERQKKINGKIEVENEERVEYSSVRIEETKRNRKEIKRFNSKKGDLLKKIEEIEKEKLKAEERKKELETQIEQLKTVDIKNVNKENESYLKQIGSLKRELDILRYEVARNFHIINNSIYRIIPK
jgi:hypothetical protein